MKKIIFILPFILFCVNFYSQISDTKARVIVLKAKSAAISDDEKQWLPGLIQEKLEANIKRYMNFFIVDGVNLKEIKDFQAKSESDIYDESTAIEIGKLMNASYAFFPTIRKAGGYYILNIACTDLKTGIRNASVISKMQDNPYSLFNEDGSSIDELTIKLCDQLGIVLSKKDLAILSAGKQGSFETEKMGLDFVPYTYNKALGKITFIFDFRNYTDWSANSTPDSSDHICLACKATNWIRPRYLDRDVLKKYELERTRENKYIYKLDIYTQNPCDILGAGEFWFYWFATDSYETRDDDGYEYTKYDRHAMECTFLQMKDECQNKIPSDYYTVFTPTNKDTRANFVMKEARDRYFNDQNADKTEGTCVNVVDQTYIPYIYDKENGNIIINWNREFYSNIPDPQGKNFSYQVYLVCKLTGYHNVSYLSKKERSNYPLMLEGDGKTSFPSAKKIVIPISKAKDILGGGEFWFNVIRHDKPKVVYDCNYGTMYTNYSKTIPEGYYNSFTLKSGEKRENFIIKELQEQ